MNERAGSNVTNRIDGILLLSFLLMVAVIVSSPVAYGDNCARNVTADIVAIDQPVLFNRLGASNVNGMIFALRRDVVDKTTGLPLGVPGGPTTLSAGQAQLRPDKRPRPLVLRVRKGDCLIIHLENLLAVAANPNNAMPNDPAGDPRFNVQINEQVTERSISLHVAGMQWHRGPQDDGSFVGKNADSTVPQGGHATYELYAANEGAFMARGLASTVGSDANQGNSSNELFGQVVIEPAGAQSYRSQVTEEELRLATTGHSDSGQPIVDYEAHYPEDCEGQAMDPIPADGLNGVWCNEGKAGLPVLNMMQCTGSNCEIVHNDINAINAYAGSGNAMVAAPDGPYQGKLGHFPKATYPLESVGKRNPSVPNRLEPYREFSSVWNDEPAAAQAFPGFYVTDQVFRYVLAGVKDGFMINYGSGGIGSEILANRLGVGPMHDCLTCAYEEFFLTSFTVGDPAMLTDVSANLGLEACTPAALGTGLCAATGPKANFITYPDDPANIHHSYTGDFVKFRNTHVGKEQHVFHLHNHQWLYNPNDDNSNYMDAQGVGPGVGYTYEINFGGSGNRMKSSGDAIFHCHFYPHFAQGMWYHWRNHDVLETGTILEASGLPATFHTVPFALENGTPMLASTAGLTPVEGNINARVRSLPDGEVAVGAPIPAVVPLPGKPMAPLPGMVQVVPNPLTTEAGIGNLNGPGLVPVGSLARVDRSAANTVPDPLDTTDCVNPTDPACNHIIKNPGYPFWVAGIEDIVGQRPPTPPLDMANDGDVTTAQLANATLFADLDAAQADGWDGGLPRNALQGYAAGGEALSVVNKLDFTKALEKASAVFYPEIGTDVEQAAMTYHAIRNHATCLPDGTCDKSISGNTADPEISFVLNGNKPAIGAPYHEPCMDDKGVRLNAGVTGDFFGAVGLSVTGKSPFNAQTPRIYKGVQIQFDAVLNKLGYHYPQQRIISLWEDAAGIITKQKTAAPMVIRNNTFDCTVYHHVNLTPEVYEIDDYQVRTPTDIIGQHIHLPKWDLTTADGAANGWNYEDGTLAAGAVRERIHALNCNVDSTECAGTVVVPGGGTHTVGIGSPAGFTVPPAFMTGTAVPEIHPYFGGTVEDVQDGTWLGARTTQQRWFFDPVVNTEGLDRGLGIIFTHDHYGPSTHQQVGLYATVLTEPAGSTWVHNETGTQVGCRSPNDANCRPDGGPTAWQAAIEPPTAAPAGVNVKSETLKPFREMYFEYSDFQHAYEAGVYVGANQSGVPIGDINTVGLLNTGNPVWNGSAGDTFRFAINPPARAQAAPVFPELVLEADALLPGCPERPCPQAIDVQDPGMFVVNYRNEPLGLRVYDPNKLGPDGKLGAQAGGLNTLGVFVNPDAGDLALAMQSRRDRAIPELNVQPLAGDAINGTIFPPPINQTTDVGGGDPFTPMVRTYVGDTLRIKQQAGGDEEEHSSNIHGVKWLQGGSGHGRSPNSGWRNAQAGGISEQYTLSMPIVPAMNSAGSASSDYGYSLDSSLDGYWSGMWGIIRAYNAPRADLYQLKNGLALPVQVDNRNSFAGVCPDNNSDGLPDNLRQYDITAVLANDVLPVNADVTIEDICASGTNPDCGLTGFAGTAPAANGRTLVYNPRTNQVGGQFDAELNVTLPTFNGPIHDPTAMLWVRTSDLEAVPGNAAACTDAGGAFAPERTGCVVRLKAGVVVEPLVLRAAAGECIDVVLRNGLLDLATTTVDIVVGTTVVPAGTTVINAAGDPVFRDKGEPLFVAVAGGLSTCGATACTSVDVADVAFDSMPDLPTFGSLIGAVKRDRLGLQGSTTFQTNLLETSPLVGLHPQLVAYDVTRDDGMVVGNNARAQLIAPGQTMKVRWYAGDLSPKLQQRRGRTQYSLVATPIEFGGSNLMPADKIKQGMKSLVGQLVIEPEGATWDENTDDSAGRQTATVAVNGSTFRDFSVVWTKGLNQYYSGSDPVGHINGEGVGIPEDPQENTHVAINYLTDPVWFRLGLLPESSFALFGAQTPQSNVFSNARNSNQDPAAPVFLTAPNTPYRLRVTSPFGTNRGSTFALHGHMWQRDPYVCPNESRNGLTGACASEETKADGTPNVGSRAIGHNEQGMYFGGQDSLWPAQHYEINIPNSGTVDGDYLFRDVGSFGSNAGLWGMVRVDNTFTGGAGGGGEPPPPACPVGTLAVGASCTSNSQCCSGNCAGRRGSRTCR